MKYSSMAIKNISKYGDTDIFPFPIENAMMFDKEQKFTSVIEDICKDVKSGISKYPITSIKSCIPNGYMGFRWATLIDPVWNAVLLEKVLSIANDIESARLPTNRETVFSYRFKFDDKTFKLFDENYNWRRFKSKSVEMAKSIKGGTVISIDISDFYNRIYHHRLENALQRATKNRSAVNDIMVILQHISNNASYGLPIGGNASRILAEIVLNSLDSMLQAKRIKFTRFVDDINIFAESQEQAYKILSWCAAYLLETEGLSLQKHKTVICPCDEFSSRNEAAIKLGDEDIEMKKRALMSLHIYYDPYSPTADDDYEKLKKEIRKHDIMGLLKDELRKSQINIALGRQLLSSIKALDANEKGLAIMMVLENVGIVYPLFPQVMQTVCHEIASIDKAHKDRCLDIVCLLIENDSYIVQTEVNLCYAIRLLSKIGGERVVQNIESIYSKSANDYIKANCIYAMINMENTNWLSSKKTRFDTLSGFERRSILTSSFFLGDEGRHWRKHSEKTFTILDSCLQEWVADKQPLATNWKLPI